MTDNSDEAYWNKRLKTPIQYGDKIDFHLANARKKRRREDDMPYTVSYINKKLKRYELPVKITKRSDNKGPHAFSGGVWVWKIDPGPAFAPIELPACEAEYMSIAKHYYFALEYLESKGWKHPNPPKLY